MTDQAQILREKAKKMSGEHHQATTVTVASGKGGTGKTSFSVNFSIALASLGKSVLLFDADFGLSNVDVVLGAQPKYNLSHVIKGEITLEQAISRGHGGLDYVAGGSGIDELLDIKRRDLSKLYKQTLELDTSYDYVIFDSGAGVNDLVLRLIGNTDECIVVATPEPTSIMDAFVLMKSIATKTKRPPVRIVMNRVETMMEGMAMSRNLKNIVKKYLNYDMMYLGCISMDKNFVRSIKEQVPLMIRFPGSRAAKDIEALVYTYTQIAPQRFGGGLSKLFDKLFAN